VHKEVKIKTRKEAIVEYPRLSDTRYSAKGEYLLLYTRVTQLNRDMQVAKRGYSTKGTKGKWRYASSKARLKCATYRQKTDLSVMGVRLGLANFFWINR